MLNESGAKESTGQMPADEGSEGIPPRGQGETLRSSTGLATQRPAEVFEPRPGVSMGLRLENFANGCA